MRPDPVVWPEMSVAITSACTSRKKLVGVRDVNITGCPLLFIATETLPAMTASRNCAVALPLAVTLSAAVGMIVVPRTLKEAPPFTTSAGVAPLRAAKPFEVVTGAERLGRQRRRLSLAIS